MLSVGLFQLSNKQNRLQTWIIVSFLRLSQNNLIFLIVQNKF